MSEYSGRPPGLTPEEQAEGKAAIERMKRRRREGNYRTNPPVPSKLKSMAPGMRVVPRAPEPPEASSTSEPQDETKDRSSTDE